jgi:enoyl-CoA hydratase/carnithine racemase
MTEGPSILVEHQNRVAIVTLNRPSVRNALDLGLLQALIAHLDDFAADREVRCLVLTGAGDRAFSAGADLKERLGLSPDERTAHTALIDEATAAIERFPVPVIAAIRGFALAGGAELATACDLRVMSDDGAIGFPEVKVGVFPGAGGVIRLPRLIGAGLARDLLFTGRRVEAEEALAVGLVDRVVPNPQVLAAAMALAGEIASSAPLAMRALKAALLESAGLPTEDARRIVARLRVPLDATRDYEEGLRAFSERRSPRFTGT